MKIHIDLDQKARKQIAQNLRVMLADTYVLYVKTQNFHWNIVDPRFYSLHLFLEKQYKALAKSIDEIAERIRMLGERSPGSLREFLELTTLKESKGSQSGDGMLKELVADHEKVIEPIRENITLFQKLGDEGSADLLIDELRFHEKTAWMLRSHFSSTAPAT